MLGGRPKGSGGGPDPARWAPRHSKTPAATARAPVAASSRRGVKAFTRGRVSSGKWHGEAIRIGKWVANRGEEVARGGLGVSPVPSCPAGGPPAPALGGASPCTAHEPRGVQSKGKVGSTPKGTPQALWGASQSTTSPQICQLPLTRTPRGPGSICSAGAGGAQHQGRGTPAPRGTRRVTPGCSSLCSSAAPRVSGLPGPPPRGVTSVPGGVLFPAPVSAAETR